jgi:SET domain-containing protein
MAEKYTFMKETYRKRLAFGKSGIHGFGIFAKLPHRAGDMVRHSYILLSILA